MKHLVFIVSFLIFSINSYSQLAEMVNPFVGTDDHGHTYPGATAPFGMIQLSPDSRKDGWDGCSGYHFSDSVLFGFSHTHLSGTGCLDYGDFLFIPTTKSWKSDDFSLKFSHKNEYACAGYYKITTFNEDSITTELTSTTRCGYHKYTFPTNNKEMTIIIDLKHRTFLLDCDIKILNDSTIVGYRRSKAWNEDRKIYFAANFSKKIVRNYYDEKDKRLFISFGFSKENDNIVQAKVSLSSVNEQGAKRNLDNESAKNFFQAKQQSKDLWEKALSVIEVEGGTLENRRTFYTCLYHCMISPNIYSDVDKSYRGMDNKIYKSEDYDRYTVFSLWDTYRSLNPLLAIIDRKRSLDFAKTFLDIYKQSGELPMWELSSQETHCMIGIHGISVLADLYNKGIKADENLTLEAMINNASSKRKIENITNNYKTKDFHLYGLDFFDKQGYISAENEHESVSKTVEYCYNMYCVAMIAKSLGNESLYNEFIAKSQYYENLFNPKNTFIQPKENGRFLPNFDPKQIDINYTEGNGWQYTFYVPQDMNTLIDLMGGDKAFCKKLDDCFSSKDKTTGRNQADVTGLIGQYAHGNEPSQHMAFLYSYAGQAYKTQKLVRTIMQTLYSDKPNGVCGNDDCGQMSAWFVINCLGFYPVCPVSNEYVIGSPFFDKVTVHLENGKQFIINSKQGTNTPYVHSVELNGKNYTKTFITYQDIINGGELNFTMSEKPNKSYGKKPENRPYNKIKDNQINISPFLDYKGTGTFTDSLSVTLHSIDKKNYTDIDLRSDYIDTNNQKDAHKVIVDFIISKKDGEKVTIDKTEKLIMLTDEGRRNREIECNFYKIPKNRKITVLSKYSPQYTAGGDDALIDQKRGSNNWKLGCWQGYWGENVEVIIDLGQEQEVNQIAGNFIQDEKAWIFMPTKVEYYISNNNIEYHLFETVVNKVDEREENVVTQLYSTTKPVKTRFIKMIAFNRMTNPSWHLSPGERSWLFTDEIEIK